jgi:hypothetical protein
VPTALGRFQRPTILALYENMNITQVYLTPNYDDTEVQVRYGYQIQTNYIQLFLEECLRKNKLDLGAFNRLVFNEGGDASRDFNVVGNNALPVAIEKTYSALESLKTDREIHDYFVSKYLEGFNKLDAHFSSTLALYLEPLIKDKFKNDLRYEKKMASKRVNNLRIVVVGRYTTNSFKLIINVFEGKKIIKSRVAYESEPDMFTVRYDVYKVEITDTEIIVINKIREQTLELKVAEII